MTTIYLAVDEDGTETKYEIVASHMFEKEEGMWCYNKSKINVVTTELPPGTIEKLTGRKITWEDSPVEYSGE